MLSLYHSVLCILPVEYENSPSIIAFSFANSYAPAITIIMSQGSAKEKLLFCLICQNDTIFLVNVTKLLGYFNDD